MIYFPPIYLHFNWEIIFSDDVKIILTLFVK